MILTHPLGLASPYPTWLKHKQSEIPPFAENIFGGKLLADLGGAHHLHPDMEFVQNFTPPDFRLKILHRQFHLISTVLVLEKTQKMSENGEIYTAGKNFTLPPALTAWTNSTSGIT